MDLYLDILKTLSEKGIGVDYDINYKFSMLKHKPHYDVEQQTIDFIDMMEKNGHISKSRYWQEFIKSWVIEAKITQLGFDYYYNHELRKATITSFKNQKGYNILSLIIAIIALIIGGYTSYQNIDLSSRVYQLEQEKNHSEVTRDIIHPTHKTNDTVLKGKL